ncbi:MAG TPA: hypothetical protein VKZ96_12825 [Thermomicrobiales bacterium]|nr:hypothetical protein [Thermomicrobiales bacterium]
MGRVLREDEAFGLLAHFVSTAELHTIEPPHYADRRILEGVLPLLDAMIRDGDARRRRWLEDFRRDLQNALAARRTDPDAYHSFLHEAPGRITVMLRELSTEADA